MPDPTTPDTLTAAAERDEPQLITVEGFQHCTDRNPDLCACGQDDTVWCGACGEEIEPGQQAYVLSTPDCLWLPEGHPEQEWSHVWWHKDCDRRSEPIPVRPEHVIEEVTDERPF